jgi:hypothetical protein
LAEYVKAEETDIFELLMIELTVRISPLTATLEPRVKIPLLFATLNRVPDPDIKIELPVTETLPEIVFVVVSTVIIVTLESNCLFTSA